MRESILNTAADGVTCWSATHTAEDYKVLTTLSVCVYIHVVNTLSVSLFIAYCGSTNVFQMSLKQKFKDAVSGAAVNITALYTHAVPCVTL